MATLSRRNTRHLLVQVLYADIFLNKENNPVDILLNSYKDESYYANIDNQFLFELRDIIHIHTKELLSIISVLAPKFDLEKIPKIHIIILMIAISELLYMTEKLDSKIILNEAIELGKTFSDIQWAKFINGTLGNFVQDKDKFLSNSVSEFSFFC